MPETLAAVVDGPHQQFHLEQLTVDDPRLGEVLVRLVAVGVCATDLHARDKELPMPLPAVLGHEGAGRVEAVGPGVTQVAVGDPVILSWPWCGACRNCQAGQPRYCSQFMALSMAGARLDGSTALHVAGGGEVHGHFFGQSSFATRALVDARSLVKVTDDVDLTIAGTLACGFASGAGAVINALRVPPGSSVAVFGPGAVGLAAIMAAAAVGASRIVAVARDAQQLTRAAEFGATATVNSSDDDPVAALAMMIPEGLDYTVECTGNPSVARQAVDVLRPLGVCALVGVSAPGTELALDHSALILGRRVVGVNGGDGQSGIFLPALLALHQAGRFPFDRLVTGYDFDQINDAVADIEARRTVKAVLRLPTAATG